MLNKYEVFLEVIRTGSLTKTAENMRLSPPAVSYAVNKLEDALGVKLLTAGKSKMISTQEASELIPMIEGVVEANRQVLEKAKQLCHEDTGTIRLGGLRAATLQWLPGLMKKIREETPEISVQPIMSSYYTVSEDILSGRLDVAIGGKVPAKSIEFMKITDDPYVVFVHKDHPLANCESLGLEDLYGESLIGPPWIIGEGNNLKVIAGIKKMSFCEVMDTGTILSMVENRYAVSVLTKIFIPTNNPKIRAVPFHDLKPKSLGLLYPAAKYRTCTMKKFLSLAQEYFKEIVIK